MHLTSNNFTVTNNKYNIYEESQMSCSIYAGPFFSGHGYPVVITTSPATSGHKRSSEYHAFYSDKFDSYAFNEFTFEGANSSLVSDAMIEDSAKAEGELHIYSYLEKNNELQYAALLSGIIEKISKVEPNYIYQIHLRNILLDTIENEILNNSKDTDLIGLITTAMRLGRVTTEKKT